MHVLYRNVNSNLNGVNDWTVEEIIIQCLFSF